MIHVKKINAVWLGLRSSGPPVSFKRPGSSRPAMLFKGLGSSGTLVSFKG